ncbi:MAG: hypothetical protein LBP53_04075 [Candidatus Peribacteria bacterium]|jgi:hypothetical protein|nr:hypothetical protein [Candidatus Peribacteria bacterium]
MNLSHYFQHYQHFHLSDEKKTEIFQRIRQKRFEQSVMRQHFFSYKKLGYSVMAVALVLMTFGGVMIEKNISIDNLLFSSTEKNPSGVYADYIAEIIEFNGEYTIQNGDITLSSQYIHNGDIIQLKSGAEMLFTLNDHSQAKIIGPASFYLSMSKENNYKIYLTQGNFFKIFNETADNTIEIIADDITIQTKKHQPLDLQIAKEGKEILIKNNGGATKLTTKTSNVTKETQLEKEIVSIKNNDINIIKDAEQFTKLLAKYNISETLTLSAPSTVSSSEMLSGQLPISGSLALHTPDPIEIFEALPVFTETGTVQPSVITQQLKTDL